RISMGQSTADPHGSAGSTRRPDRGRARRIWGEGWYGGGQGDGGGGLLPLWHRLLERTASESGRLRHGDGGPRGEHPLPQGNSVIAGRAARRDPGGRDGRGRLETGRRAPDRAVFGSHPAEHFPDRPPAP